MSTQFGLTTKINQYQTWNLSNENSRDRRCSERPKTSVYHSLGTCNWKNWRLRIITDQNMRISFILHTGKVLFCRLWTFLVCKTFPTKLAVRGPRLYRNISLRHLLPLPSFFSSHLAPSFPSRSVRSSLAVSSPILLCSLSSSSVVVWPHRIMSSNTPTLVQFTELYGMHGSLLSHDNLVNLEILPFKTRE